MTMAKEAADSPGPSDWLLPAYWMLNILATTPAYKGCRNSLLANHN